jgi:hypothetical protein
MNTPQILGIQDGGDEKKTQKNGTCLLREARAQKGL